jgi:hypothetical protein
MYIHTLGMVECREESFEVGYLLMTTFVFCSLGPCLYVYLGREARNASLSYKILIKVPKRDISTLDAWISMK